MAKVLLVDDDDFIRSTLYETLIEAGHRVDEASDGDKALRFLSVGLYDIVLTDVIMPQCDGIELIKAVRERGYSTKIIVISGGGVTLDVDSALRWSKLNGADETLTKPFSSESLLATIQKVLVSDQQNNSPNDYQSTL